MLEEAPELEWAVEDLLEAIELERRSDERSASLTVVHAVEAPGARQAAALAGAWAEATTNAVRDAIRSRIADTQTVSDRVADLRSELERAEDNLSAFTARDASAELAARESALTDRLQDLEGKRTDAIVALAAAEAEVSERLEQLGELLRERSTLTGLGEEGYRGLEVSEAQALATSREASLHEAWSGASQQLMAFDAEHPLGLWDAELSGLVSDVASLGARQRALERELASARAERDAAASALGRLPRVEELRTALIDASSVGDALVEGRAALDERAAVQEAQNPAFVSTAEAHERALRSIASIEASLQSIQAALPEMRQAEAALRRQVLDARQERRQLENEVTALEGLVRDANRTARSMASLSSDGRLAPSGPVAQVEQALRDLRLRTTTLRAELDAATAATAEIEAELELLRGARAALERERASLVRDVEIAEGLYLDVAALTPTLEVIQVLAPLGARVLSPAYVPAEREPSGALRNGLLSGLLAMFLGFGLVLFRQALAAPAPSVAEVERAAEGVSPET